MQNILLLAQAPGENTSRVSSEQINSQQTQTKAPDSNQQEQTTKKQQGMGSYQWIFLVLMVVIMYFLLFRGPKKKQKEHKSMVNSLQKNDKVSTIGGIIGTVIDVKDDEITLKVDEANNTKIKVTSGAIGAKLSKTDKS